jgi:collagenase-like PrtC family protease
MKLSLGPVPYYWPRDLLMGFYAEAADWPLDIVYLGETICSKRRSLTLDDWLDIGGRLEAAGKQVVLSTLALLEAESELKQLRRICANGRFSVEANDLAAVQLLSEQGLEFVTGPTVNIYNSRTLALLGRRGLRRWVLPVELGREDLRAMQAGRPTGIETEVIAYGRLPLALSARCFTARSHNLPKDDCRFRCLDYPDGRLVFTREVAPFLVLNGIQTQSARTCNLLPELDQLGELGGHVRRISPQAQHTQSVVEQFAACLRGETTPSEASTALKPLMPLGGCDGYWRGDAGMQPLAS